MVLIPHAGPDKPRNYWNWLDWEVWARSGLTSFPVESSKGPLLLLHLLTNQNYCWEMSQPVSWIPSQPTKYLHYCARLITQLGLTIIVVTHDVAIAALVDRTIAIRDGRTSTETVRRDAPLETIHEHTLASSAVIGLPSETHRESVVIDRAGRLQLPKEALERISFNGRAEIRIVNDHVELWPLGNWREWNLA